MKLKGNKGEWSEFYAFVKLLSTGKLYAANENLEQNNNIFFPIIKIFQSKKSLFDTEYLINFPQDTIQIYYNGKIIKSISQSQLSKIAVYLFTSIKSANKGTGSFEIPNAESIMNELKCSKISAPSSDKTDITLQLHDIHTGYDPICGFSIKSELGSAPTLLNASKATNFIFEVTGLTDKQIKEINSINTKTKIIDRITQIKQYGTLKYLSVSNETFSNNLMLIDTYMDKIIAEILLEYYSNNTDNCKTLVEKIETCNPLHYPRTGAYEYKLKKFLCSIALGMKTSTIWNGHDEANGGYIIVKYNGDVVAYHIYNRNAFESYLLENTKLDKGSTNRHEFALIYKGHDNKFYINLNLQIRFHN